MARMAIKLNDFIKGDEIRLSGKMKSENLADAPEPGLTFPTGPVRAAFT